VKKVAIINLCTEADVVRAMPLFAEGSELIGGQMDPDLKTEATQVVMAENPSSPPSDCDGLAVIAPHSDAAGAAGYHELFRDGRPVMYSFLDAAVGGLLYDTTGNGDSLFEIFMHEFGEAKLDETANLFIFGAWRATKTGRLYTARALEACDPVQGIGSKVTLKDGTAVGRPAWVVPRAYFDTTGKKFARYDSEGALKEAGAIAPQGYQIAATLSGEKDVFAHVISGDGGMAGHVMARKKKPRSRTTARLVQLAAHLELPHGVDDVDWY